MINSLLIIIMMHILHFIPSLPLIISNFFCFRLAVTALWSLFAAAVPVGLAQGSPPGRPMGGEMPKTGGKI